FRLIRAANWRVTHRGARVIRIALLMSAVLVLSACGTKPTEAPALESTSTDGAVIVEVEGGYTLGLKNLLLPEPIIDVVTVLKFDPVAKKPVNGAPLIALKNVVFDQPERHAAFIARLQPGTYVVASTRSQNGNFIFNSCLSEGTFAFDIKPGQVTY